MPRYEEPTPIDSALVLVPLRNFPEGVAVSLQQIVARSGLTPEEAETNLRYLCELDMVEQLPKGNYRLTPEGR